MKIISKFKDYYDFMAVYGEDPKAIFRRLDSDYKDKSIVVPYEKYKWATKFIEVYRMV